MRQLMEGDWLHLSFAVPKVQWDSNPTVPTAIRLWETFFFYTFQWIIEISR